MRDSVTSKLLSRERDVGGEVSGSRGHPRLSTMEQTKVYERAIDDADVEEKLKPVGQPN